MTEPSAALDGLIQRLRAYTNRDADPGCSIDDPECCRACLELHAADTLAAQAAQLAEVTAERDAERGALRVADAALLTIARRESAVTAERDAQVREAFNLIRDVEKGNKAQDACCPICTAHPWDAGGTDGHEGHYDGCRLAAFLARAGAVGSVGAEPKET